MLKITVVDTALEQRLILEGRLTEPEIFELDSAWENARATRGERACIVDLRSATFIDHSGETILLRMQEEGAIFVACGVSTTHQLRELGIKCSKGVATACK